MNRRLSRSTLASFTVVGARREMIGDLLEFAQVVDADRRDTLRAAAEVDIAKRGAAKAGLRLSTGKAAG